MITMTKIVSTKEINNNKNMDDTTIVGDKAIEEARMKLNLKEYVDIPQKLDEYKVIGQIIIPKINIEKYILEETTKKSLRKSVTKICGPEINQIGNFCIAGHNYKNMFGKINSLEIGDKIIIKDTYSRIVKYEIYQKEKVSPYNTECLSQNTKAEREITLVTCTVGATKRIIIKAIEVYD